MRAAHRFERLVVETLPWTSRWSGRRRELAASSANGCWTRRIGPLCLGMSIQRLAGCSEANAGGGHATRHLDRMTQEARGDTSRGQLWATTTLSAEGFSGARLGGS